VACLTAIESNGRALTDTIFNDCLTIDPLRDWEASAATLDDGTDPHGTARAAGVMHLTASLYFTFSLPPLSMREIGAVIPPLHPRDQRQGLRNRQGAERQHDFHEPPQL
jgi:hypothetical protein